ncbi:MAG TPA: SDR family oxidoreductase [Gemmataceae bacterium]|nr:SDR family oxidoreductase [Gemmataceae bacterium]
MAAKRRLVVITGATRGLGRAMTAKLAALGHTVLGCGRSPDRVEELRRLFGPPHDFDTVDVANDGQVRAWAERLLASHGSPDLLLNNAALINRCAPLWQVPREEFDQVIDVNIKGTVNVLRHFLPAMIARQSGVIVNFSSGWGRSTSPQVAPYCATKWAIEGLTQALAQELPRGLAAVALNPGVIDTDMLRTCWGDEAGGYPDPATWAERAVPFLLQLGPRHNGESLTAPS